MKILYYSSTSFADCDFPLVRTMMERGYDVTYLIELSPDSCHRTLFNIEKCLPIDDIIPASSYKELQVYQNYMNLDRVFIMNRGAIGKPHFRSLLNTIKVIKFIKKGRFDILHTDMLFLNYQALLYMFKQWIITVHDPFVHSDEDTRKNSFFRKLCFFFGKKFVILNKQQLPRFCETYQIKRDNVLVNNLGVYDNIRAYVRKEWKVKGKNVLFFGRIAPYKGLEFLCEAMKKVHSVVPDATLTIAGSGKIYFDISEYKILPYIEIINRYVSMEELAHLLYQCSMTVCPYKDATQSGVIMTSFSMYKPVIATNVGGLKEMVEDGDSGIIIKELDAEILSSAIISLLMEPIRLEEMSCFIRSKFIEGDCSWNAICDRYINFYNKS